MPLKGRKRRLGDLPLSGQKRTCLRASRHLFDNEQTACMDASMLSFSRFNRVSRAHGLNRRAVRACSGNRCCEHARRSRYCRTGQAEGLTRDDILDNITITWLTNTALSGARLYWEYWGKGYFNAKGVSIPVAVSVFPDELYPAPRSWTERAFPKLMHYNKLDKGGHFAAWEQPKLFSEEVRAGFRPLQWNR